MNRKWLSTVILVSAGGLLFSLSSCGHDQELVSIQIQPPVQTFGTSSTPVSAIAGQNVQLRALGTYIHPPVTKDITTPVTWASNDTEMMTVGSNGVLTATGLSCGSSLISATVTTNKSSGGISSSGALVTGYMTGNVVCSTSSGGGVLPVLTLTFMGSGSGTVTSSPPGLSCASPKPCLAQLQSGATVTLTATPINGSTFGNWAGCDSAPTTNPCTITMTGNKTVTATFN
jgi:hypothetical protein